jgi:hypothetical protein
MRETERPTCSFDHPIWVALSHYTIGPEDADLPFAARLARENGWSAAHAARVLEEYKRFCFLAATAGHAVTPSDAVDQAWHLHLTYSRDYWERFCPSVLGRPLHHEPTAGGRQQGQLFFAQYAETLKSYERVFGDRAPEDLWPKATKRPIHDPRPRRVHGDRRPNRFAEWISDLAEWITDLGDAIGAGGGDGASCGGGCGG